MRQAWLDSRCRQPITHSLHVASLAEAHPGYQTALTTIEKSNHCFTRSNLNSYSLIVFNVIKKFSFPRVAPLGRHGGTQTLATTTPTPHLPTLPPLESTSSTTREADEDGGGGALALSLCRAVLVVVIVADIYRRWRPETVSGLAGWISTIACGKRTVTGHQIPPPCHRWARSTHGVGGILVVPDGGSTP
jgi:hypothetical protein